jgi:hypothetical protein
MEEQIFSLDEEETETKEGGETSEPESRFDDPEEEDGEETE